MKWFDRWFARIMLQVSYERYRRQQQDVMDQLRRK